MATKAERFRWEAERSGPKRPPKPRRPRRDAPVNTAKPGVSASDRKAGLPHKESKRADRRKAIFVLEDSEVGPSRRSTRKASNRQRTDTQMIEKRRISLSRPNAPQGRRGR
jgi:hypothetical protein